MTDVKKDPLDPFHERIEQIRGTGLINSYDRPELLAWEGVRDQLNSLKRRMAGYEDDIVPPRDSDRITELSGRVDALESARAEVKPPSVANLTPNVTIAEDDGCFVFEWWSGERKVTAYVNSNALEIIRVDGKDVIDDDYLPVRTVAAWNDLWRWLTASATQPKPFSKTLADCPEMKVDLEPDEIAEPPPSAATTLGNHPAPSGEERPAGDELGRAACEAEMKDRGWPFNWELVTPIARRGYEAAASAVERIVAARVRDEERQRAREGLERLRFVLTNKTAGRVSADVVLAAVDAELAAIDAAVKKEAANGR